MPEIAKHCSTPRPRHTSGFPDVAPILPILVWTCFATAPQAKQHVSDLAQAIPNPQATESRDTHAEAFLNFRFTITSDLLESQSWIKRPIPLSQQTQGEGPGSQKILIFLCCSAAPCFAFDSVPCKSIESKFKAWGWDPKRPFPFSLKVQRTQLCHKCQDHYTLSLLGNVPTTPNYCQIEEFGNPWLTIEVVAIVIDMPSSCWVALRAIQNAEEVCVCVKWDIGKHYI